MSLERLNNSLIYTPEGFLLARGILPPNPSVELVNQRRVVSELETYVDHPLFDYFKTGVLATCLHSGLFSKGYRRNGEPRFTHHTRADTTLPTFYATLKFLLPEFAAKARLVRRKEVIEQNSPQYTLVVSGETTDLALQMQAIYQDVNRTYDDLVESDGVSDKDYALLAGIVATGKGTFRISRPDQESYLKGNIGVYLDFPEESRMHRLIMKLFPNVGLIDRNDGDGPEAGSHLQTGLRMKLSGEDAFELSCKLLNVCPPLGEIRPEILTLIFYATNDALTPAEYRRAYEEILGI